MTKIPTIVGGTLRAVSWLYIASIFLVEAQSTNQATAVVTIQRTVLKLATITDIQLVTVTEDKLKITSEGAQSLARTDDTMSSTSQSTKSPQSSLVDSFILLPKPPQQTAGPASKLLLSSTKKATATKNIETSPTELPLGSGIVHLNRLAALQMNVEFDSLVNGSRCDSSSEISDACIGYKSVVECNPATGRYEFVANCPDALACLALPLELQRGTTVGCDKIDDAASRLGLSLSELQSIMGGQGLLFSEPSIVLKNGLNRPVPTLVKQGGVLVVTVTATVFAHATNT